MLQRKNLSLFGLALLERIAGKEAFSNYAVKNILIHIDKLLKDKEIRVKDIFPNSANSHSSMAKSMSGLVDLKMDDLTPSVGGIGLQDDSEWQEILNHHILKMLEGGILQRIDRSWLDTEKNEDFDIFTVTTLGFENVLFPFSILAMGITAAMSANLIEYLLGKKMQLL